MNPEIKAKWLAALRSGEYKQTTQVLRYTGPNNQQRFCCLGVLCDLYAQERMGGSWKLSDLEAESESIPGQAVSEWASFPWNNFLDAIDNDPVVTIAGETMRISKHNDAGRTFAEIADAIEEQL